jgi:hypothetical protein
MPETELQPSEGKPAGSVETDTLKPEQPVVAAPPPQDAWLLILQNALASPFLTLLKSYLEESNGNPKHNIAQCVSDFRHAHPISFWSFFILDAILKLFYISVAVIIALRGLGLLRI